VAREFLEKEKTLRYRVIPAIKQLHDLDSNVRDYFKEMARPYNLIVSKDDNRVSFRQLQAICNQQKFCTFYAFDAGKHLTNLGKQSQRFTDLIIALTEQD